MQCPARSLMCTCECALMRRELEATSLFTHSESVYSDKVCADVSGCRDGQRAGADLSGAVGNRQI